jgi:hypothetical protein
VRLQAIKIRGRLYSTPAEVARFSIAQDQASTPDRREAVLKQRAAAGLL